MNRVTLEKVERETFSGRVNSFSPLLDIKNNNHFFTLIKNFY